MGLDQYAFAKSYGVKEELAYWRKHPNLQGWMERLWISRGRPNANSDSLYFNCVDLQLTAKDLDDLEYCITNNLLPSTSGFFFGSDSDEHYKSRDLEFVKKAREALDNGMDVWYSSWW